MSRISSIGRIPKGCEKSRAHCAISLIARRSSASDNSLPSMADTKSCLISGDHESVDWDIVSSASFIDTQRRTKAGFSQASHNALLSWHNMQLSPFKQTLSQIAPMTLHFLTLCLARTCPVLPSNRKSSSQSAVVPWKPLLRV